MQEGAHLVNAANAQVLAARVDGEGEEAERHVDDDGVRVAGGEGGLQPAGGRVQKHGDGNQHGGRIHVHARHRGDDGAASEHQQRRHNEVGDQRKAEEYLHAIMCLCPPLQPVRLPDCLMPCALCTLPSLHDAYYVGCLHCHGCGREPGGALCLPDWAQGNTGGVLTMWASVPQRARMISSMV